MLFSKLLFNSKININSGSATKGLGFLLKANYIEPVGSGFYSFLNLGFRSIQKIENIIRDELNKIGCQEILMNVMQPKSLWEDSGRYDSYNPPLFKLKDIHDKDLVVAPTHEELITKIVKKRAVSYRHLPIKIFQIQVKFRNELRAKTGILRLREFLMKDLYSFHGDLKDLNIFYDEVLNAYSNIFKRIGFVNFKKVLAYNGSIGGSSSYEFIAEAEAGEDKILACSSCDYAINKELLDAQSRSINVCPNCNKKLIEKKGIELGHIFKLDDLYSKKLAGTFIDKDGTSKPYIMGCYGIGISRILGAIAEVNFDESGLIMPKSIAPYSVYLSFIEDSVKKDCDKIYRELLANNIDVLYDDRSYVSIGEKFFDADLIGFPFRVIVSKKTGSNKVELKLRREEGSTQILLFKKALSLIQKE